MRILILLLISISTLPAEQEGWVYFYGVNSRPLEGEENAIIMKEVVQKSESSYLILTRHRTASGWQKASRARIQIIDEGRQLVRKTVPDRLFPRKIIREIQRKEDGIYAFRERHADKVLCEGSASALIPLHLEGEVRDYYPGGRLKSVSQFKNNQLRANLNWLGDGRRYVDSIFYSADQPPTFEYGGEFFNSYIIRMLEKKGIDLKQFQDEVVIGLVIMETGKLKAPVALQGKSKQLTNALVSIISDLPGVWKPAILNGEPVRYFLTLPISVSRHDVTFQNLEVSSGVLHYDAF